MPTMTREDDDDERPSQRRHRSKGEKNPNRPHKSRSSRPKVIDPETGEPVRSSHRRRKEKDQDSELSSVMASVVPELARTASAPSATSRSSLPYPSFSKEHSREAVTSKEELRASSPRANVYTPQATDLGSGDHLRAKSTDSFSASKGNATKDERPPSPPDTADWQRKKAAPTRMAQVQEEVDSEQRSRSPSSRTRRSPAKEKDDRKDDRSKVSSKSRSSKASTAVKTPLSRSKTEKSYRRDPSIVTRTMDNDDTMDSSSAVDSNATSVAPKPSTRPTTAADTDSSPESAQDSSPRTPTQPTTFSTRSTEPKSNRPPYINLDKHAAAPAAYKSPQPPPPPPPPAVPMNIPRVDYLMQNGGLPRPVPKTFLAAGSSYSAPQKPPSSTLGPAAVEVEKVFGPFYNLLDQYSKVMSKNGSIAVATGYRSVARRLLERLEAVFARDLSSQECSCVICQNAEDDDMEPRQKLGWGDVLEYVGGRRELPAWPAFDFGTFRLREDLAALGISERQQDGNRPASPIKIDPDVAEEFREHYLRQSQKTKASVDKWLSTCPEAAAAPPQEVDDGTLIFAISTHLDPEEKPIFNALMSGSSSDLLSRTAESLQRLYRLPARPRDPEAGIFLLKHPEVHQLLATLAEINPREWEILTSGRFDGFLWSGAESEFPSLSNTPIPSRGPTPANGWGAMSPGPRNVSSSTPFSPGGLRNQPFASASRGPTPVSYGHQASMNSPSFQARQPVSNDEETEIAALAEVEREIYQGMEALEDAFEGLHRKAEDVRRALRERGAGLSLASQSRNSHPDILRLGTPTDGPGFERVRGWGQDSEWGGGQSESDWGADDLQSEIAPDDSASNISTSRHRRPKRRNERRTPAPVEEEDEE